MARAIYRIRAQKATVFERQFLDGLSLVQEEQKACDDRLLLLMINDGYQGDTESPTIRSTALVKVRPDRSTAA